jgi:hypothetical protein
MTNSRYGRHFLAAFMVILWVVAVGWAAEVRSAASPEWDSIVQRAEEEGQVTVYATDSIGNAQIIWAAFQKRYPKIKLVGTTLGRGSDLFPKLFGERRAGKFLADVFLGAPSAIYLNLYRAKIVEPIPPILAHPNVTDLSKWWMGKHHYIDAENQYIFVYLGSVSEYVSYHAKSVESGEIRSYWDFLQPKWKGKILSRDPKISGSQRIALRGFYHTPELGAEFIRRLYGEMDVTLTQEIRQATDWLAHGKFAICFFCSDILKIRHESGVKGQACQRASRTIQRVSGLRPTPDA